jgi:hypothetical protein
VLAAAQMLPIALRFLFAVYALADGVLALVSAFRAPARARGWLTVNGALNLTAGLVAWLWLPLGAASLRQMVGVWALVDGGLRAASGAAVGRWWVAAQVGAAAAFALVVFSGSVEYARWVLATGAYAVLLAVLAGLGVVRAVRPAPR